MTNRKQQSSLLLMLLLLLCISPSQTLSLTTPTRLSSSSLIRWKKYAIIADLRKNDRLSHFQLNLADDNDIDDTQPDHDVENRENRENEIAQDNDDSSPVIAESVVRIDDGGSDLTNRFKYKVNALMGTFDPIGDTPDTEYQNGNILNAMLTFPTRYSFNAVGRTGGDDKNNVERYVVDVSRVVSKESGRDETELVIRVTPRGGKFTRVTVEVTVESASVVNEIYEGLGELEGTVMRY